MREHRPFCCPGSRPTGFSPIPSHPHRYHGIVRGSKRELRAGLWELRVSLGYDPETGKRHQVSKTFHGGARAADAALRDLVDQHAQGRTDGIGVTVGQLLDRWLEECERLDLSPMTVLLVLVHAQRAMSSALAHLTSVSIVPRSCDVVADLDCRVDPMTSCPAGRTCCADGATASVPWRGIHDGLPADGADCPAACRSPRGGGESTVPERWRHRLSVASPASSDRS